MTIYGFPCISYILSVPSFLFLPINYKYVHRIPRFPFKMIELGLNFLFLKTYSVESAAPEYQFMIAEPTGGVVGQMAGIQQRLDFPAGTGVTPVGMTASQLAQRRAFRSVGAGIR